MAKHLNLKLHAGSGLHATGVTVEQIGMLSNSLSNYRQILDNKAAGASTEAI